MREVKLQLRVFQAAPQHIEIALCGPGSLMCETLQNVYENSMPQRKRQSKWARKVSQRRLGLEIGTDPAHGAAAASWMTVRGPQLIFRETSHAGLQQVRLAIELDLDANQARSGRGIHVGGREGDPAGDPAAARRLCSPQQVSSICCRLTPGIRSRSAG